MPLGVGRRWAGPVALNYFPLGVDVSTWVSLCTSSCTQLVGTILTEDSSDSLIRSCFFGIQIMAANNGLQKTFNSKEGDTGNISYISMLCQERRILLCNVKLLPYS